MSQEKDWDLGIPKIPFKKNVLEAELCILQPEHAGPFSYWVNEGVNTKYLFTGTFPTTPERTWDEWEDERENKSYVFALYQGEHFIGTCGLYHHMEIYRSAELRILIARPDAVGNGTGTVAVRSLLTYGFDFLNLHRIWLGVNADNERAIHCYKNNGFVVEGEHRDALFIDNVYHSTVTMAVIKFDWKDDV